MARIRSIKPEFWHDRKLARSCSRDARMLYVGLWNHADEHGRANGDPAVIKGQVFPYDDVDTTALLAELVAARRVFPYEVDGDPFLFLPKLATHQRLDTAKVASKLPAPPENVIEAPSPQVTAFPDESGKIAAEFAPGDDSSALLYVAGSMEHVAGSREGASRPATNAGQTDTQRSKALVDEYAKAEPMCKWPAVNGVVLKAIRSKKFSDSEIQAALLRLAKEGRSVTVDSLRYELAGMPTGRASPSRPQVYRNPSDQSVYDEPLEAS